MFLEEPPGAGESAAYRDDRDASGYVWNFSRLWAWRPDVRESFVASRTGLLDASTLSEREVAVLVAATASQLGDSYCSLAWGGKLAKLGDAGTAAGVLGGGAEGLSAREAALAGWARQVVRDPNGTDAADVAALREAGLDDREIFEATALVAFRLAFSTVNDALGVEPDRQLADAAPEPVRAAVTFGRPPAAAPSRA